jgi:hypothetical protein
MTFLHSFFVPLRFFLGQIGRAVAAGTTVAVISIGTDLYNSQHLTGNGGADNGIAFE